MTVGELIEALKSFDQELEVAIGSNDEGQVYFEHEIEVELHQRRDRYGGPKDGQTYVVIAS